MPYYNLTAGLGTLSEAASDRAEALEIFGQIVGETLTFEDQGCVAEHMFDEWTKGPHWVHPHVPVWVKRDRS